MNMCISMSSLEAQGRYLCIRFRVQTVIMSVRFGELESDYLWVGFKIIYGGLDSGLTYNTTLDSDWLIVHISVF